ncbi:glycosyltransferase family 4 protein [Bacillus cereus]|uniref:glycosyltransferase family 4 protein n=1 Tax=Bacillus cereus TaxID=1396 RepID=UPI0022235F3A|nr:glycosyltransferase family 4 protein [Bacillus cereus]
MRILLVSNMYPNKEHPNYGVFVKNTEEILVKQGIQIDKIVMYKGKNKFLKIIGYLKYYISIILNVLVKKYDVIYVHYAAHNAIPLLILKKLKKGIRIYTNVHGSDIVPETRVHHRLQGLVTKLLKVSCKIIVPSNYYKELVEKKYRIEGGIEVFPSGGVNSNIFYPITDREPLLEKMEISPDYKYIGYVGRLDYKKGWDVLLQSIYILKNEGFMNDKKLIVVGNGKDINKFRNTLLELDLDKFVIHYTLLPQKKLNDIYNCLDVFCFPTMREGESLGLVGLEAMATGLPVIGSEMGGLLDYIKDGENGLFFSPGNKEELAIKIKEFFGHDAEFKAKMREQSIHTANKYEVKNIEGTLINIFL